MKGNRTLLSLLLMLFGVASSAQAEPAADAPQATLDSLKGYFFAAARSGEMSVLNEFLVAGFPVNECNDQSYTALMIAAYQGQMAAVELLLEQGANACLRDKRGHTALMGAIIKGEWRIAKVLYAVDCDRGKPSDNREITDKATMTAAQFAERFGQGERFKALENSAK
ncbi:ankyrin repeat domain-containing protein [Aeromonas cavernicola]|uniref:Uncharacterized protein n=1 Tax=Aeromonas cavernicola TaxID=1006623 RepID=A0A2H9U9J0_9GAMM|nr:ankyrin repeat domain-containing protein [Aeromonas cavernicola]PJG60710.1 hypothetical protein CUC53_00535 [Aeromonas cavernicola]